jgi:hypothetical protein
MITTNKTQLTSREYFEIILTVYFKKKWWLIAWIWIAASVMYYSDTRDSFGNFLMILFTIYPFIVVFQYWRYANSKVNKIFLLERLYEIYEDKIIGVLSDGTDSTIMIDKFIKVIRLKNTYLLYMSKNQFIYISKNCFKSEQDKDWFEKKVISKI